MVEKVSIVIPVYNAERYLKECIESALNQTYSNIEIIAVDDGSKDNSLQILKKYSDKIKIVSKQNGGTASALNVGIKIMTGEWFKWLSADDILYPNAVEELIHVTQNLKNKENTILYSNYDIIDSYGNVIKQFLEPDYNDLNSFDFNVILLDHYIGNGITSLIHKSALDEYGIFDETIGFQEDYEFWLRCCLLHGVRLHLVPKILVKYRVHEKQLTKEKAGKSLENANKVRNVVLSRVDPVLREKYEMALMQYKKNKPLTVKARHLTRDLMFKFLPKTITNKILKFYLNRKDTRG